MYVDYHHTIHKEKNGYIFKEVDNYLIQQREFRLQKELSTGALAPKVKNFSKKGFEEQLIKGVPIREIQISDTVLIKVAEKLRKLHELEIPDEIRRLFQTPFNRDGIYKPHAVYEEMKNESKERIIPKALDTKISFYIDNVMKVYRNAATDFCIIHGDLSLNNIFLDETNEVIFIDWADARVDLHTLDIAQFFHLSKLSIQQQEIFIQSYKLSDTKRAILRLHQLFHYIYDLHDHNIQADREALLTKIREIIHE